MEKENFLQKNLPTILWIAVIASIYFVFSALITPFVGGITLNSKIVMDRLQEIGGFLLGYWVDLQSSRFIFTKFSFASRLTALPRS